ncbi:hypothetical protein CHS0354_020323 [Potamilus streckersoni]|uniref:BTB domain-containing protein n=1 Tax=Potamilus streckersoni TaxID=2493646 RepID=A0AAE0VVV9_9BIVA|nr:hypothetical protein CHS0354_020323 [Potamilus streckersoni]
MAEAIEVTGKIAERTRKTEKIFEELPVKLGAAQPMQVREGAEALVPIKISACPTDDIDWQAQRDVLRSNRYMLENHIACDLTFYIGKERKEVMAHKYVLISRSSVFYAMLCGPVKETGPVSIPDIEPTVFDEFLRFIYYEAFQPNGETVMPLLYTAKKYAVSSLVSKCVNWLENEINLDNVCAILQQAQAYDEANLRRKCLEFIMKNGSSVLKHSSFIKLSPECVEMVLTQEELYVKEEEVYEAMKNWARNACVQRNIQLSGENLRKVLGSLLHLIRFSVMDQSYFADKVAADNLLTSDEKVIIFRRFHGTIKLDTTMFKHTPRKASYQTKERVLRFHMHNNSCISAGSGLDAIQFRCSESMCLLGMLIYGSADYFYKESFVNEITVQLLDESKRSLVSITRDIIMSDDKLHEILFDNPVILQCLWYTITLRISRPCDTRCGENGKKSC